MLNQPIVFQAVGWVWIGAFAVRVVAAVIDRPELSGSYLGSGAFELLVGLILVLA